VIVSGSGGTVTVNDSPATADTAYYTFGAAAEVKLKAISVPGYRFVSWTGANIDSTDNPFTVDMTCNITIQANFYSTNPVLTMEKHGNGAISPAAGQYHYPPGTVVNLKASPDKGWKFDGWTENVDNPSAAETSLILNTDARVAADFSRVWSIWMIPGMIAVFLIIIGGITWLTVKYRKKLKSIFPTVLRSNNTSFVFRLILGGIFIFTGFAKINGIPALIAEINQYKMLPSVLASLYGNVLPYIEIAVGVVLVLGIALRITASIAGLMLISFAAAKIFALIMNLNITICYCFGAARPLLSNQSLAIDVAMLLLAAQIIRFRSEFFSIPDWFKRKKPPSE
jgi:uncharacterized membrane protein YphA (DoxX/SURF4 family)